MELLGILLCSEVKNKWHRVSLLVLTLLRLVGFLSLFFLGDIHVKKCDSPFHCLRNFNPKICIYFLFTLVITPKLSDFFNIKIIILSN